MNRPEVITRTRYLNELLESRENGMVKIITGIRRCGKSFLLNELLYNQLLTEGVDAERIIRLNLDDYENRELRNPDILYDFIKSKLDKRSENYLLLDEIQLVDHFEEVLNGMLSRRNVEIFVTGSNARLLSKDIVTEFRGRGQEIRMYPLSFSEYMSVCNDPVENAFYNFMIYGSLPQIFSFNEESKKIRFLNSLFVETYLNDIKERYRIKHDADLEELLNVIASSVGSLTNPLKLSNTFRSVKKSDISYQTIKNYLDYMEDCFLIEKSRRFDIKGKKHIDTPYKYYFADTGLRNVRLGFSQIDPGHLMENIVFNELRIRGYNVDVGVVPVRHRDNQNRSLQTNLEVDFVCTSGSRKYYIQSAYKMNDEDKIKQEMASLARINDSHKKIILVSDRIPIIRNDKGIVVMSIYDFLLKENSLEL